jgi:gamma-glutamyltranspeptidase/glutathione hydrolase
MTLGHGADIYAPGGKLLTAGEPLRQPGMAEAIRVLVEEGPRSAYAGTLAEALLQVEGITLTAGDLARYEAVWGEPAAVEYHGVHVATRGGLSGVPELLARLPVLRGRSDTDRLLALASALGEENGVEGHTTNLVAVDEQGRACVLTTSLGLGAGEWLLGFDLHLNSMLGEQDLIVGELLPGARMESMMAPTLVLEHGSPTLAVGSAGGTRLRTALATVLAGIVDEGLPPQAAVDRPRVHAVGETVHAEPGVDERALEQLEAQGRAVRRWPSRHHYFGGVSCVGTAGAAADPRRSGAAIVL